MRGGGGGALARGRQAREHGYTPSMGFQIASWSLIPKKGCWNQGGLQLAGGLEKLSRGRKKFLASD